MDLWTQEVTDPFVITKADNVYRMSITAKGGSIFIQGNLPFRQIPSAPIEIKENGSVLLVAYPNSGMNISIDPNSNIAQIIIFEN